MGRSRAVHQPADDDPSQRSKRKRIAQNVETFDTAAAGMVFEIIHGVISILGNEKHLQEAGFLQCYFP